MFGSLVPLSEAKLFSHGHTCPSMIINNGQLRRPVAATPPTKQQRPRVDYRDILYALEEVL
jgi:hypothetical protein